MRKKRSATMKEKVEADTRKWRLAAEQRLEGDVLLRLLAFKLGRVEPGDHRHLKSVEMRWVPGPKSMVLDTENVLWLLARETARHLGAFVFQASGGLVSNFQINILTLRLPGAGFRAFGWQMLDLSGQDKRYAMRVSGEVFPVDDHEDGAAIARFYGDVFREVK